MPTLGFIGLGVMGEPMCRNLAARSGHRVVGLDVRADPLRRLADEGVEAVDSIPALARRCDAVLLSLPGGDELEAVCAGAGGLLESLESGKTVVDLGTSPVDLTRDLAARFAARGVDYADAPVARTRRAAQAGTLSVMVGAPPALFERIRPWLACMASDVTHCGDVGAGQVVKIMNNMVLFQTVVALAEALAVAKAAGVDGTVLFETLAKGSADSFALRNHGMNAMLAGEFPEQAFSTEYALEDLSYALELAASRGLELEGAGSARRMLERSRDAGYGRAYFPALANVVGAS